MKNLIFVLSAVALAACSAPSKLVEKINIPDTVTNIKDIKLYNTGSPDPKEMSLYLRWGYTLSGIIATPSIDLRLFAFNELIEESNKDLAHRDCYIYDPLLPRKILKLYPNSEEYIDRLIKAKRLYILEEVENGYYHVTLFIRKNDYDLLNKKATDIGGFLSICKIILSNWYFYSI